MIQSTDNGTCRADGDLSPVVVDAPHAARLLGIGERLLAKETKAGRIPCVRIGRRVLYSVERLRKLVDGDMAEERVQHG